ncbi:hypothetical protein [Actibacterium sp. MT2.3-13A]|uniref:hypothetical protein n=1 Tax=Actibacterium sp. MT2.3-13A TaxID=2828332 RepID=UPI001BA546A3|nr:hypothetical protein [Actibacterium sp. MT2.3-13A]
MKPSAYISPDGTLTTDRKRVSRIVMMASFEDCRFRAPQQVTLPGMNETRAQ